MGRSKDGRGWNLQTSICGRHSIVSGGGRGDEKHDRKDEGYLDEKRLELNTEKTKIIRYRKGGKDG